MDKLEDKRNLIKTLIIKLMYIIMIPIIIYDLFLIIQTIKNPEDTPDIFGIKTFSIISGSMRPTINVNDIIIVKQCEERDLKKGDIISFKVDDEIITHRIVLIENIDGKTVYSTKGDDNNVIDTKNVEYNQIEGKYIGKIPRVGKILKFLKNKVVFGVIIILLIVLYIHERNTASKKIRRKEKRKKFEEEQEEKEQKDAKI